MIKIMNESIEDDFDAMFDFGSEEWTVDVPKECIKGATLLSVEEYGEYKDNISKIGSWWWLRFADNNRYAPCYVSSSGNIFCDCCGTFDSYGGIRPALILNLQSSNFEIGDKLEFGEHFFTILSNKLAICDDIIGKDCFREDCKAEDASVYEKSDIKKVVDNWFNKSYAEYEE